MPVRGSRAGFTGAEVLSLLVIGLILAAIIYGQRYAHPRPVEAPEVAAMRTSLLDLKAAELRQHDRTGRYSTELDSLGLAPAAGITRRVDRADSTGWHATAEREGSAVRCQITVGLAPDSIACGIAPVHP